MKKILFKLLSGIIIISQTPLAKALEHNVWHYTFGQGAFDLDIQANKTQFLHISCDFERHRVRYSDYTNAKIPSTKSNTVEEYDDNKVNNGIPDKIFYKSLAFKMNGKIHPFPMSTELKTKQEFSAWNSFANDISKASKIEIIRNGKAIATFFPSFRSMENIKNIKSCYQRELN